jgi:peptidyl-prolyl cis-trans isomerase D
MAEAFGNTLYEQSDSLKPAADKLGLKIETIDNLARTPSPALAAAPYNNAKFLAAIFSTDSLKNKRNTEPVQVAPNTLMAGRVVEFKPASKRPLAEVDAVIRQRVTIEEAAKLARKAGEAKLAAARASATPPASARSAVTAPQPEINGTAAMEVLKADVSKPPAYGRGPAGPGPGHTASAGVAVGPLEAARRKPAGRSPALGQQDSSTTSVVKRRPAGTPSRWWLMPPLTD